MPPMSGAVTPQSPLRISHDGEFYARLLTRESSAANPSFRYYGAGPAAVPFGWESHPGTPKDASCCRIPPAVGTIDVVIVPAITPPPSYNLRSGASRGCRSKGGGAGGRSKPSYKKLKWINKMGFIAAVLRRLSLGKPRVSSASSPTVHSSSSSTRWLFSGAGSSSVDDESGAGDMYYPPAPKGIEIRPSPWMARFCGHRREADDWVHGRP